MDGGVRVTCWQKGECVMAREKHKKKCRPAKTEADKARMRDRKYERQWGGVHLSKDLSCAFCHRPVPVLREKGIAARVRSDGKCVCALHKDAYRVA